MRAESFDDNNQKRGQQTCDRGAESCNLVGGRQRAPCAPHYSLRWLNEVNNGAIVEPLVRRRCCPSPKFHDAGNRGRKIFHDSQITSRAPFQSLLLPDSDASIRPSRSFMSVS